MLISDCYIKKLVTDRSMRRTARFTIFNPGAAQIETEEASKDGSKALLSVVICAGRHNGK